ncbi:DUF732 domain-containing protein [Mycobacterium montefiorense]|uniref:DUF732 domain-containing protein n=1 Tax=Mycobacterium montefiorense TaxID=154654 RepID=A0AA37V4K8_9MYCO|nr:DUF732 domain-containing protein [Mycobacterium montefiorense]GBG39363.1 hypothetical protein MmonteBS_37350 [Mycobacterium montefiorense]GKU37901.1 hypothetical protein NJB14191_52470 [Mycobacterium montefiorense]GKU42295.1 hypothetical protein NJB14192_42780 [Mycobacterium montefiorense]GKU44227.1 hypothetical protein NJB14194_08560 [Mycobacterium montefiorense]GKU53220.1 hypothetical protein NJB14195_44610 [Mycobacterium montefiorense]
MKNTARMAGPIAAVVAGLLGIAAAPSAHADPADDTYLQTLQQRGLSWANGQDQTMINVGHAVCTDFAGGDTMEQTVGDVKKALGVSNNGAGSIVGAAVAAYCPENRSKM